MTKNLACIEMDIGSVQGRIDWQVTALMNATFVTTISTKEAGFHLASVNLGEEELQARHASQNSNHAIIGIHRLLSRHEPSMSITLSQAFVPFSACAPPH